MCGSRRLVGPREIKLRVQSKQHCMLANLLSNDHCEAGKDGKYAVLLEPYGYRW